MYSSTESTEDAKQITLKEKKDYSSRLIDQLIFN